MDAVRAMLAAALAQPRNSQFVLLSESEVPLYPAVVVWRQLQGETKSRINACSGVRPSCGGLLHGFPMPAGSNSLSKEGSMGG